MLKVDRHVKNTATVPMQMTIGVHQGTIVKGANKKARAKKR